MGIGKIGEFESHGVFLFCFLVMAVLPPLSLHIYELYRLRKRAILEFAILPVGFRRIGWI